MEDRRARQRKNVPKAVLLLLILAAVAVASGAYQAIYPAASGRDVYKGGGAVLDASNANQGYFMAKMSSSQKIKVRVKFGEVQYTYDLEGDGEYEVYPLQNGSGSYTITFYEQVKGTSYAQAYSKTIKARMEDEYAAFLCPNRYSWYTLDSPAVALSQEICRGIDSDEEKVAAVFDYLTTNLVYDYITAVLVTSGSLKEYVPDLDAFLEKKTGICFDFAALMCAMLRSQGIPTRLVMGYADEMYHAWNSVWIDGEWVRYDATAVVAFANINQYTEEAVY